MRNVFHLQRVGEISLYNLDNIVQTKGTICVILFNIDNTDFILKKILNKGQVTAEESSSL